MPFGLIAALMVLMIGAACGSARVYASEFIVEPLTVKEVWLTGDTLHINVTDRNTGVAQTLELSLSDYANAGDEFVSIQAVDREGNKSNVVQFKSPYYQPAQNASVANGGDIDDGGGNSGAASSDDNPDTSLELSVSAVHDGSAVQTAEQPANGAKPFTPEGAGTVLDDVTDGDGKEFFSITTEDGNVFYLIVDRQRNAENVYLLNAVNEDDLASLAKPGDGKGGGSISAIPATAEPTIAPAQENTTTATEQPAESPAKSDSGNMSTIAFVVVAAALAGGAGYYFKVVRPKSKAADTGETEDYDDTEDEDEDDGDEDFDDEEVDLDDEEGGDEE